MLLSLPWHPLPSCPERRVQPTEAEREANNALLRYEDEVRTAYEATFVTEAEARSPRPRARHR